MRRNFKALKELKELVVSYESHVCIEIVNHNYFNTESFLISIMDTDDTALIGQWHKIIREFNNSQISLYDKEYQKIKSLRGFDLLDGLKEIIIARKEESFWQD